MQFCKNCLQPHTRPGIKFDKEGVCGPCNYYDSLKNVDWNLRKKQLEKHVRWCKQYKSESGYDCIISVSGGKDSTRQAMIAKNLGLKPLLVSTVSPPEMLTDIGVSNIDNLNSLGFDIITVEPNAVVYKKLLKKAFVQYGNYGKATELALYASAPRIAVAYNIKMIFLGENNSLVYGEDIQCEDGGDASDMINYNTLGGGNIKWMIDKDDDILYEKLFPYQYPSKSVLNNCGLKIVYLGYYIHDFNNLANGEFAIKNGLKVRDSTAEHTGSIHNFDALDEDFVHINQMIKYFKFGFGKATDEVCELIRMGKLTKSEGLEIIKQVDGRCHDDYIHLFCKYLGIEIEQFWKVANSYRNPDLWGMKNDQWILKSYSQ